VNPIGKELVEMLSAVSTAMESSWLEVALLESVTLTVKPELPVAAGVPEIVFPLSVKPVGKDPAVIDQV
jgi:hypothetical protein